MKVFILVLILIESVSLVRTEKKTLELLTLLELINGTASWPACSAAIEVVIEAANENENILPDYHLVQNLKNEGFAALLSNMALINFIRNSEATGAAMAPSIIGPRFGCENSATTLKALGFVQFSPLCTTTNIYEQRDRYAIVSASGLITGITAVIIGFIEQVGKWKQIAIIADQSSSVAYKLGLMALERANDRSIDVVYFGSDPGLVSDSTIEALKASDARIVVLSQFQPRICIDFLCKTYKAGMRAPQYVFIQVLFNCLVPNLDELEIPKYVKCTKEEVASQLTTMFGSGRLIEPIEESTMGAFGYDYNEFQRRLEVKTQGIPLSDYPQRLFCHDAAMAAIITMNQTETRLKQMSANLSIADFASYPLEIQKVALDEAHHLDFSSIRVGKFKVEESDGYIKEDCYIAQAYNGSIHLTYRLPIVDEGYNGTMKMVEVPVWGTKDNQIPKDLSKIVHFLQECNQSTVFIIFCVAFCSSVFQGVLAALQKRYSKSFRLAFTGNCVIFNIAAIIHSVGSNLFPHIECRLRPFATAIALSLMNSSVAYVASCFSSTVFEAENRVRTESKAKSRNQRSKNKRKKKEEEIALPNYGISLKIISLVFLIISAIILIFWISLDPMLLSMKTSPVFFSERLDQYSMEDWWVCWSDTSLYWIGTFIIGNGMMFVLTSFVNFKTSKLSQHEMLKHFNLFRMSILNQFILLFGFTLIMIVTSSFAICTQSILFSSFLISYSFICHLTMFFPSLCKSSSISTLRRFTGNTGGTVPVKRGLQ